MQGWEDPDESLDEEGERPAFLDLPFEQWPVWCHQGLIEQPEALVEKARALLSSERWEEVVVGLTLVTGRCVPEVLKTGVLFPIPKKRYLLLFTAYLEQIDEVVGPFELPTLVEAEQVLLAWQRARSLFNCTHLAASQICRIYRSQVCAVARRHFAELLPIDAHADGYTPMLRRIYARIAARYYCPMHVVREWFMDLVQGFEWDVRDERVRLQWCEDCRRDCYTYAISDGAGNIDGRDGLKLGLEGVEWLGRLDEQDDDAGKVLERVSGSGIIETTRMRNGCQVLHLDEQDGEVLQEVSKEPSTLEEEETEGEVDDDDTCEMWVRDETFARFDQVAQQLGAESDDEVLVVLLEIDRQRRVVERQVLDRLREQINVRRVDGAKGGGEEEDERTDRVVRGLIDTYEEQTYAVQVYLCQCLIPLLEPLAREFKTSTPVQTLQALIASYEARKG